MSYHFAKILVDNYEADVISRSQMNGGMVVGKPIKLEKDKEYNIYSYTEKTHPKDIKYALVETDKKNKRNDYITVRLSMNDEEGNGGDKWRLIELEELPESNNSYAGGRRLGSKRKSRKGRKGTKRTRRGKKRSTRKH